MKLKQFFKTIFSVQDIDNHWVIALFGLLIKIKYHPNLNYPKITSCGINVDEKRERRVIASLTSFPPRVGVLHKTISTLLNQSFKPDMLILWLADNQFPNKEADLPQELLELKNYGLTIRWCEDLKSFKKLVPALREYPEDIIVTFDDDICYEPDTLEALYKSYQKHPNEIQTNRIWKIRLLENDTIQDYKSREMYLTDMEGSSFFYQLTGCGGVLYPPHSLYHEAIRDDIFMKLIPTHDDIYFWAMSVLARTKTRIVKGYRQQLKCFENTQDSGLCKINKTGGKGIEGNEGFNLMLKTYPEMLEILKSEK